MAMQMDETAYNDSHNMYGSEEFEQELPGESSSLPLQHQAFEVSEKQSDVTAAAVASTTADNAADSHAVQQRMNQQVEHAEAHLEQQQTDDSDFTSEAAGVPADDQPATSAPASPQQQHHRSSDTSNSNPQQLLQQPPTAPSPTYSVASSRPVGIWARTSLASVTAAAGAASPSPPPGRPSYAELSLRCQALENALEQQQQHAESLQQALAAAHAAQAAEESSMRDYYEAQLSDRQSELQLLIDRLAAQQAAVAAAAGTAGPASSILLNIDGSVAAEIGSRAASPWPPLQQQQLQGGAREAGSPSLRPPSRQQQQQQDVSQAAADVCVLRRELAQAEQLLNGYQDENKAAARRIKDLEGQLSVVRAALADEAGRAQRAAAAASEAQRANGAAAAERLSRQLQLEAQLDELRSEAAAREAQLMSQIEALRRDKAAAEARAVAAAAGLDTARWQSDDAVIADLRNQLSEQAASHQQQLSDLQAKLAWYAENQALLGQSDAQLAQQAAVIRDLEGKLREADSRRTTHRQAAGRIADLEQQVSDLKQALMSRHPTSLPAAALAALAAQPDSAALAASQATIQDLQDQLDQQQQQHEHGLRALQQQYETLKNRLEQRQAQEQASAHKGRVRDLTQQLEDQRNLYIRKIRTLEAKLTAAQGAAAAAATASRRSTAAGNGSNKPSAAGSRRPTGAKVGLRDAAGKKDSTAAAGDGSSDVVSLNGDQQEMEDMHTAAAAAADPSIADGFGVSVGMSAGVLQLKDRQLASLTAQLEERTSQFLAVQQKLRLVERQLKQLSAGGTSKSPDSQSPPTAAAAAVATADTSHTAGRPPSSLAAAGRVRPGSAADGAAAGSSSSWPALCAELESEVYELKTQLTAAQHTAHDQQQQICALRAELGASHSPNGAAAPTPPIPLLLSVADEAASREAVRWRDRVRGLEEALHESQSEVSDLQQEVAHCRSRKRWSPSAAAFEALERKIISLEAAQRQRIEQQQQQQQCVTAVEVQAIVGRYEQVLAAKDVELQGFRVQLDALITAAKQLQGLS